MFFFPKKINLACPKVQELALKYTEIIRKDKHAHHIQHRLDNKVNVDHGRTGPVDDRPDPAVVVAQQCTGQLVHCRPFRLLRD